ESLLHSGHWGMSRPCCVQPARSVSAICCSLAGFKPASSVMRRHALFFAAKVVLQFGSVGRFLLGLAACFPEALPVPPVLQNRKEGDEENPCDCRSAEIGGKGEHDKHGRGTP